MARLRRHRTASAVVLVMAAVLFAVIRAATANDWRSASRESVGVAPAPARAQEAIVQVYAARVWGWRGAFGVHSWVAVKPENAQAYTVYEVIGWQLRWSDSALVIRQRQPDERWYGNEPELLADVRGAQAAKLIGRIDAAARAYPWAGEYAAWPGPNSNTFTAWVLRAVPELRASLPPTAIGKDYLGSSLIGPAPGGSGGQVSLGGMFAVTAGAVDGVEVNLLGLSFGVDPWPPAIKLPMLGRIGFPAPVSGSAVAE
jgi:hypothetical protein